MKTSRPLLTLFVLCAASLSMSAQINDTYVIAAAANQPGNGGTHWKTQFSVFNPWLDWDLVVSITYLPTGGGKGLEELVRVPKNSLAYSDNLLLDLFDVQGGGALLVATFPEDNPSVPNDVLSRSFLVTSNTFTDSRDGTYGQTIPGVWTGLLDYDSDGISAIAHGIRDENRNGWRTNVGALNLGRCEVELRVSVYNENGQTILNKAPFFVPPMAHIQHRLPIQVTSGSIEFFVEDPCVASDENYAVVFPYTSTVDVISGDPSYQVPTLLATPNVLFAKSMKMTALKADPASIGKKITSTYARSVRNLAERRGMATLVKDERGLRIQK